MCGLTCYPAAGKLAVNEFPEIEDYAMARNIGRILFKNGDQAFNEDRVYIANLGWLKVFDWQMISGDRSTALNEPEKLILTESSAKKYFGDQDPIGQMMTVVLGDSDVLMKVSGVVKDVPENAHLKFDILISYETGIQYFNWTYDNWNGNNEFMYLLFKGAPLDASFAERFNKSDHSKVDQNADELLVIQPMTDIKRLAFKNEVTRLPQVASMSFSETLFGQGTKAMNTTNFYAVGKEEERGVIYYFYRVDAAFIPTFGFDILAGRTFDEDLDKEAFNTKNGIGTVMLLNETARELMGFQTSEEAIGGKVAGGFNFQFDILGVFNDYNHHSLKTNVDPTIFIYNSNSSSANYTSIKVKMGQGDQSYKAILTNIESVYREVYPSSDFDYYF